MDLSGMIFIALALGWAVYLIPKALQQHEEMARSRGVERFSSRLRVLGGTTAPPVAPAGAASSTVASAPVEPAPAAAPAGSPRKVTRAAARRAAARRRRVLYLLTFLLAGTAGAAYLGYLPWFAVAAPAALIVAFLVIARLTVRREQRGRRRPAQPVAADPAPVEEPVDREDTIGVPRADLDLEAPPEQPLADEGSLWDPLPVTLPTYVSKPAARRTVRTIELTQGQVTSSGHDAADSRLVREAETAEASEAVAPETTAEQRRAAGA